MVNVAQVLASVLLLWKIISLAHLHSNSAYCPETSQFNFIIMVHQRTHLFFFFLKCSNFARFFSPEHHVVWCCGCNNLTLSALKRVQPRQRAQPRHFLLLCSKVMGASLKARYLLKYITYLPHSLHTYLNMNQGCHVRISIHLKQPFSFSTY